MSFCRFETVKTDNSDTCRFYILCAVSAVFSFHLSVLRFTKERLNTSIDTSKKNDKLKFTPQI